MCSAEAASPVAERVPDVHFVIVGNRYSRRLKRASTKPRVRRRFAEGALAGRGHDSLEYSAHGCAGAAKRTDAARSSSAARAARQVLLEAAAAGVPIVATRCRRQLPKSSHPIRPNSSRPATPRRWRRPSSDLSRMSRCAAKKPPPPGSESANSSAAPGAASALRQHYDDVLATAQSAPPA